MLHRLGLDVGTNSLGWSLISLDNTSAPQAIIDTGARIFDDGRVKKSLASLKADRRVARQARRRRDRFLQRQKSLRAALIKWGLFPPDKEGQKHLETLDPYDIRARAIDEMCDPYLVGRAFWHINQRRGFKSNRKTADNEAGVVKKIHCHTRTGYDGSRRANNWRLPRTETLRNEIRAGAASWLQTL